MGQISGLQTHILTPWVILDARSQNVPNWYISGEMTKTDHFTLKSITMTIKPHFGTLAKYPKIGHFSTSGVTTFGPLFETPREGLGKVGPMGGQTGCLSRGQYRLLGPVWHLAPKWVIRPLAPRIPPNSSTGQLLTVWPLKLT